MRGLAIRHAALVTLAVAFAAAAPGAYALFGPKWSVQQVEYYINPVNGDGIAEDAAIADIQAAAMAWTTQSSANILPYYMGRTSGSTATMNGRSEMFFRNASKDAAAATTYFWSDSSNRLIEADIVIWDASYKFVSGSSGCSGAIFLQDVMTHEFGHALGIAHSSLSSATMYPTISYCSTKMRSLDADDIAGIEKLYPASGTANTAPTVSITTPASGAAFADGSSISFSGTASDKEQGNLGASITWLSSLDGQIGTGTAFSRVLSAGSHQVTARVTDAQGLVAEAQLSLVVEAVSGQSGVPDGGISITGRGYKVKGTQRVDLSWSGASTGSVDVYRDGARIAITPNDGSHTDAINKKGGGSYTYKVCGAGTSTCSNQITIGF